MKRLEQNGFVDFQEVCFHNPHPGDWEASYNEDKVSLKVISRNGNIITFQVLRYNNAGSLAVKGEITIQFL